MFEKVLGHFPVHFRSTFVRTRLINSEFMHKSRSYVHNIHKHDYLPLGELHMKSMGYGCSSTIAIVVFRVSGDMV